MSSCQSGSKKLRKILLNIILIIRQNKFYKNKECQKNIFQITSISKYDPKINSVMSN